MVDGELPDERDSLLGRREVRALMHAGGKTPEWRVLREKGRVPVRDWALCHQLSGARSLHLHFRGHRSQCTDDNQDRESERGLSEAISLESTQCLPTCVGAARSGHCQARCQ
jgi:hypothetical protein